MLPTCFINDEIRNEEDLRLLAEYFVKEDVPGADCIEPALRQPPIVLRQVVKGCIARLFELEKQRVNDSFSSPSKVLSEQERERRAREKAESIVCGISPSQLALAATKEKKTLEEYKSAMVERLLASMLKYEF